MTGGAQRPPQDGIQLVVPFPPGGVDLLAKLLIDEVQRQLDARVTLVYRPGAAGAVGAGEVAQAEGNGLTLLFSPIGPVLLQPAFRETPYTWRSFAPVCRLTTTPVAILVSESSPYRRLDELLQAAQSRPQAVSYVTAGAGGIPHVAMAWLCRRYGLDMRCVEREGAANAVKAVLAGEADVFAEQAPLAAARLPEGGLRVIAMLASERMPAFPDAPTALECGVALILSSWNIVAAPRSTPAAVVQALSRAFESAMRSPAVAAAMQEKLRVAPAYLNPDETAAFIEDEAKRLEGMLAELWGRTA